VVSFSNKGQKKYVINIDQAWSKVHLNPLYYNDMWCNLDKEHERSWGGKLFVDGAEAEDYLKGNPLAFQGKLVTNLSRCENCSRRCRQSKHWDI